MGGGGQWVGAVRGERVGSGWELCLWGGSGWELCLRGGSGWELCLSANKCRVWEGCGEGSSRTLASAVHRLGSGAHAPSPQLWQRCRAEPRVALFLPHLSGASRTPLPCLLEAERGGTGAQG